MSIVIEATELLEHFQWGDDDITSQRHDMAAELSDILTYLVAFALATDIDISTAFHDKLEHLKQKYPTTTFNPNNKDRKAYYKIKQEYRANKQKGQP
jgi:NTP pyrophosphatase (non-canonical NTP hydrolase)